MRYLPTVPWRDVTPGTVVLDAVGTPRTVVGNWPDDGDIPGGRGLVLLEGEPRPHCVWPDSMITPVELDAADAIGNLHAAGLNPRPIGDQPS